ncbi:MAG: filamentous hemagglutinin N-terminal domain-containing protein [Richelia sp. SM1_7_0]|nr:filamentous hemagglutinin N-terminal domain-containing protein [Richelia sp. SM1_7_0]NJR16200.1 filamentous hemagglutinin N-terminal domain-containing protein [Calothrix sp. CSU_2_0]
MTASWQSLLWKLLLSVPMLTVWVVAYFASSAVAQITPDSTLRNEGSQVIPLSDKVDRIDGGAIRGTNLFHSFQDFNVGEGRGAYFGNPAGIENILSRVTGGNPSRIFGTLGVLGNANLYLLNPNGIIFGANAKLDIRGSFVGSTAGGVLFNDRTFFGADQSQTVPLLTMAVPVGLQYGTQQAGNISNAGNLAVGQDLTLSASNLDLQGKLEAGRNLTLQANDIVRVRDSVESPFSVRAGSNLSIQGNQGIDILALNHSGTPFQSGGNLSLVSDGIISGDAHFASGGNFSISNLANKPGNFVSLYDPIISATGDVNFGNYKGAALKVEATGSITGGNIEITTEETSSLPSSDPDTQILKSSPALILRAGLTTLTNASNVPQSTGGANFTSTNGQSSPGNITVGDINTIGKINNSSIDAGGHVILSASGIINVTGNIRAACPSCADNGDVILNASENITTKDIDTSSNAIIEINSRNSGITTGRLDTSTIILDTNAATRVPSGNAGSINLIAKSDIVVSSINAQSGGGGKGGNIDITTSGSFRTLSSIGEDFKNLGINNIEPLVGNASIATAGEIEGGSINITTNGSIDTTSAPVNSSSKSGNGGNIKFNAAGNTTTGSIFSNSNGTGKGGDITLTSQGGTIDTTAGILNASSIPLLELPRGNAGKITLDARNGDILSGSIESTGLQGGSITLNSGGKISLNKKDIASITTGSGRGGNIELTAKTIDLTNARVANVTLFSNGQSGDVVFKASDSIDFRNTNEFSPSGIGSPLFQIFKTAFPGTGIANTTLRGTGNGGNVTVETKQFTISNKATLGNELVGITTSTRGSSGSRGGDITIKASESVTISGNQPGEFIPEENQDTAQLVNNISTGLTTATLGEAKAGNLTINTGKLVLENGVGVSSGNSLRDQNPGKGDGGNLTVNATQLVELTGKAALATSTSGSSNPGTLVVNAGQVTLKDGALFAADTLGDNPAGNVEIVTNQLKVQNGSRIGAATGGNGTGGSIKINTPDKMAELVEIDGTSADGRVRSGIFTNSQGSGKAGDIEIYTDKLNVLNRGEISVSGNSSGASGDINVTAGNISMTQQAGIRATTSSGEGGNINLTVADSINMKNDGNPEDATEITARAFGTANGGNITMRVGKFILGKLSENNDIVAEAFGGNGGRIDAKAALSFEFVQHEKGRRIPESEYIASSSQGLNGIVNVSTQDFQPIPIPDVPIVRQVPQVCPTSPGVTTRPAGRSAFSNAGRGGLPPNPGDALESNIVQVPWVTLNSENTNTTGATSSTPATNQKPEAIAEAEGWQKLPNGKVIFTTKNSSSPLPPCILESSQQ